MIILYPQRRKGLDDFLRDEDDLGVWNEMGGGLGDDVERAFHELARMNVSDAPRVINAVDGKALEVSDVMTRNKTSEADAEIVR